MDMDVLDIYEDLDEFQEVQEKKSKELLAWETKYNESLQTIEDQKAEIKTLNKKIKTMEVNFQNLLDTARAELNRKDKQLTELRKEKDDICFRRKPPRNYREPQPQQRPQQDYGNDRDYASGAAKVVPAIAVPKQTTPEVASKSSNPFVEKTHSRDPRDRSHAQQEHGNARHYASAAGKVVSAFAEPKPTTSEVVPSKSSNPFVEKTRNRDPRDRSNAQQEHSNARDYALGADKVVSAFAEPKPTTSEVVASKSVNPFVEKTYSRDPRDRSRAHQHQQHDRHTARYDSSSRPSQNRREQYTETDSSNSERGGKRKRDLGQREERDGDYSRRKDYKRTDDRRDEEKHYERADRISSSHHKNSEVLEDHKMEQNKGTQRDYANKEHTKPIEKVEKIAPKELSEDLKDNNVSIGIENNKHVEDKTSHKKPQGELHKILQMAKDQIKIESDPEAKKAEFEKVKHTSLKEDKRPIEKIVKENISKSPEFTSNEDTQKSPKTEKALVPNNDLEINQDVSTKTAQDLVHKTISKPESTDEINIKESDSMLVVSKNIEPSNSIPTTHDKAKPELSTSATQQTPTVLDSKIQTPPAHEKSEPNRDVNSNHDQTATLSTPKKVAIFNALFGTTPSSAESDSSAVSSKLLTNVMQILRANDSNTTSPSVHTDDSEEGDTKKKPMPLVIDAVKPETESITSEEVNGYFTTNENSEPEETTVDLPNKNGTKENSKPQKDSVAKIANIVPSLNAVSVNAVAKSIPTLGDSNVVELQMAGLWKKSGIVDLSEVIEIEDDTDADITSEEERRLPCIDSEKKEVAVPLAMLVPLAKEKPIEMVDLSEETVERPPAIKKAVEFPPKSEEAVELVGLSEETVGTTQASNKTKKELAVPSVVTLPPAKDRAVELVDLPKKTVETSSPKNKTKQTQMEIVAKEECAVPSDAEIQPTDDKSVELVGLTEETVETTQANNKSKKAHIEIIENIRLPSLFELPNKTTCVDLTNELRNFELNAVEAVTKEATKVKSPVKVPKKNQPVKGEPKNEVILNVIDTIDISDDNDSRSVDNNDVEIDVESIGETIVEIGKEQIADKPAMAFANDNLENPSKIETIEKNVESVNDETAESVNEVKESETVKSFTADLVTAVVEKINDSVENLAESEETTIDETNEKNNVVSSNVNENQESHCKSDEIVNIPEPNNLLAKVSKDVSESKNFTTVAASTTADNVVETLTANIDEMSRNITQQNLEQNLTIVEEKQLIEKDGIIYELTITTEVAEKVTLVTDEITIEDDESQTKIEQEMYKMHHTPKKRSEEESNSKKFSKLEPTEVINANQQESIIAAKPTTVDHSKDEHKPKLEEATIVIDDDCEDIKELVNIANTANKHSVAKITTLTCQDKDDNADKVENVTQCKNLPSKKIESTSLVAEATSSQHETADEISIALSQLRDLQNSSEARRNLAAAKKETTVSNVTKDAVVFVTNNSRGVIQADEPSVAISKNLKKNKSPIKVEMTINSSKQSKSIVKPLKIATKKLAKCKAAERKVTQNDIKIILPKTKKALHKTRDDASAKPSQKAEAARQAMEIALENKPDAIKVKNVMQFKIPKNINRPKTSVELNKDAVNNTKEMKTPIALEDSKIVLETRPKEPETSSKVSTDTKHIVNSTEDSEKLANSTIKPTNDITTSNANVENSFQVPDSTENANTIVKEPAKKDIVNVAESITSDDKTTPKKSHNKTETNASTVSQPSNSPTTSNASTEDFAALQNKPKNYTLKRRILDSSSSDEELQKALATQKKNSPKVVTPKREFKRKRMSPSVKLATETALELETNCAIESIAKKSKVSHTTTSTSPFTQRLDSVAIFDTEVTSAAPLPAISPANSSQDAKFKELDLRMQNMFQSPTRKVDYLPEAADDTFNSTIALNDDTQTNITVEETIAHDSTLGQSSTSTTSLDTSVGGTTTKRLSLGKRDYVFEKVSENVVNIFVTRRRGKKQATPTTAATALPNETPKGV